LGWIYREENSDSSRYYSQTALRESEKINYLTGMGRAHTTLGMVENGVFRSGPAEDYHYLKSVEIYKNLNDQYELANLYYNLAYVYKNQGNYEMAVEYFKKSILLIEKTALTPNEINIMYNGLSYFFQEAGNYKESFEYRKKSFELYKKGNDTIGIVTCLQSFGNLFSEAGDKESANIYYQKAIDLYHANTVKKAQPMIYLFVGLIFLSLSNNDSALYYLDKAVAHADSQDWTGPIKVNFKRFAQTERAKVFLNMKEYAKSIECLKEPLEFYVGNIGKKSQAAASILTMAEAQFGLKNYPAALEYAKEAFHLATELKRKKDTKDASRLLWKTYDKLSNTDSAYYFLQQFLTTKEALEKNRSLKRVSSF
jgi:tetratricopeptide (TPR) repeat protein